MAVNEYEHDEVDVTDYRSKKVLKTQSVITVLPSISDRILQKTRLLVTCLGSLHLHFSEGLDNLIY